MAKKREVSSIRKNKNSSKRKSTRKVAQKKISKRKLKNKSKELLNKRKYLREIETEIIPDAFTPDAPYAEIPKKEDEKESFAHIDRTMFSLPSVESPLAGTPKDVKEELNNLAKRVRRNSNDQKSFDKIHLYMHGHLLNVVLRKFPFIKGMQATDIYQETLIALRFKAIPKFDKTRGMSFLNFAKMCIRKHLITILHTSRNRKKDLPMNYAVSIDSPLITNGNEDENNDRNTLSNILEDGSPQADEVMGRDEAFKMTFKTLFHSLSTFEKIVLEEYLNSESYKIIAKNVSIRTASRYDAKSIDNALLRIRKKALELRKRGRGEDIPLFVKNSQNSHN